MSKKQDRLGKFRTVAFFSNSFSTCRFSDFPISLAMFKKVFGHFCNTFLLACLQFSKENNNVSLGIEKELPPFPTLPNLVSVENDATLAKSACAVGYAYQRKIEAYGHCSEVVGKAVRFVNIFSSV